MPSKDFKKHRRTQHTRNALKTGIAGAFFVFLFGKSVLRRQKFLEGARGEPFFKKVSPKSTHGAGQKGFDSFFFWRLEAQKKNQKNARAKGEPLSRNRKKNRIVFFVRALPRHPASF